MAEHSLELSQHEYTAHLSALSGRCAELEAVAAQKQLAVDSVAAANDIGARQAETLQQQTALLQQQQRQMDTELRKARQEAQEATMSLLEQQAAGKEAASAIREQVIKIIPTPKPWLDWREDLLYIHIYCIYTPTFSMCSTHVHISPFPTLPTGPGLGALSSRAEDSREREIRPTTTQRNNRECPSAPALFPGVTAAPLAAAPGRA